MNDDYGNANMDDSDDKWMGTRICCLWNRMKNRNTCNETDHVDNQVLIITS